jgi:hypothetical protein
MFSFGVKNKYPMQLMRDDFCTRILSFESAARRIQKKNSNMSGLISFQSRNLKNRFFESAQFQQVLELGKQKRARVSSHAFQNDFKFQGILWAVWAT